jgi:hypothetical protein
MKRKLDDLEIDAIAGGIMLAAASCGLEATTEQCRAAARAAEPHINFPRNSEEK